MIADGYKTLRNTLTPKTDRKVYRELNAMSDRELHDMGICRGDIKHIAQGGTIPRGGWTY
jgi:uncharacterized protein YjiS (DUF1127 family)